MTLTDPELLMYVMEAREEVEAAASDKPTLRRLLEVRALGLAERRPRCSPPLLLLFLCFQLSINAMLHARPANPATPPAS